MGHRFSRATSTQNNDEESTGLSPQRRDILNERKRLDDMEQNRKDDGYSQDAIEKERQRLKSLETAEDTRELLSSTVDKFQENLKTMKTVRDTLNGIENVPGEVKTFCHAVDDACKDGEETETVLNDFKCQANLFFNKNFQFQLKASKEVSVEVLKVQSDDLISELNKVNELNKSVQFYTEKFKEKVRKLNFEALKTSLEKIKKELNSEQLKLIGIGIGASLVALTGVGLVVGFGITLWKFAPVAGKLIVGSSEELKDFVSTFWIWVTTKVPEFYSDVSRNREELKSIEQCLEVLSGLKTFELNTDEVLMALESTLSEAQDRQEQMCHRLEEHQKVEQMKQKVRELEQQLSERDQEIARLKEHRQ